MLVHPKHPEHPVRVPEQRDAWVPPALCWLMQRITAPSEQVWVAQNVKET